MNIIIVIIIIIILMLKCHYAYFSKKAMFSFKYF